MQPINTALLSFGMSGQVFHAPFLKVHEGFNFYAVWERTKSLHKETATPGVGIVYDLGSHLIDQALQLFGMPHSVFADIDVVRPNSQVDDYFELLMFYHQFRVRIHSSLLVREQLPAYILHGRK